MPWLAVTLTVDASGADALSDALLAAGAMSVETTDADAGTAREAAWFDQPGEPGAPTWARATVGALFEEGADIAAKVAGALRDAGMDPAQSYGLERVEDRDWVRATQSQFKPVRVSARLWVVPTWHVPPDPAAVNLVIDPGLAFGTGTHPSTRLCLEWLEATVRGGESVLDYGCGSGILAIAAMKLGAARATGVDIDAAALVAARYNALQNEVTARFIAPDDGLIETADIVLANILAHPLQVLAPLLARATRGGGRIALAGILDHQVADVRRAYAQWFALRASGRDDGWVLLEGTRGQP
jgi:ribosomal protein L11 methyltransferase